MLLIVVQGGIAIIISKSSGEGKKFNSAFTKLVKDNQRFHELFLSLLCVRGNVILSGTHAWPDLERSTVFTFVWEHHGVGITLR